MDVNTYLERINYNGSTAPTAQTLQALQYAHLLAVPFENLSIHIKEPVVLDDGALFDKVVKRRRGGFCYELNGLFSWLLRELGFDVVKISASVARDSGEYTPDFAHMTLMVTLDERWLVDVGFGDTFRRPLRIDQLAEQPQEGATYQIRPNDKYLTLYERKTGGDWKPHYRFTLDTYNYPDYAYMCHHYQVSPDSHFRQGRVCTRITPDGRVTLSEMNLIRTWLDGHREEQALASEEQFHQVLMEQFDIQLQR